MLELVFRKIITILILYIQRIRASLDEKAQKQLLKELEIVMKTSDCPFIVNFYGAIFKEVSLQIFISLYSALALFQFSKENISLLNSA